MIKIKPIGLRELQQVLHLLKRHSDDGFEYAILKQFQQLFIPLQRICQVVPPGFRHVPAIYVAVAHNKVLGLIWLRQDGVQNNRWVIEQLLIDPDESSYDVGSQLVHYAVNHYGGQGVQSFLARVDNRYEAALELLKAAGFRQCTRRHTFVHTTPAALKLDSTPISGLREARSRDRYQLAQLYADWMPPEVRPSLESHPDNFSNSWLAELLRSIEGRFCKRWVIEDPGRQVITGYLELRSNDYRHYDTTLIVASGWSQNIQPLLNFGVQAVLKSTRQAILELHFYEFNQVELNLMEAHGFTWQGSSSVLIKDYWIPIKDKPARMKSPILLFEGKTSPA